MGTICFVILNYKTWREAAACAESILKTQQGQDIRIVLVDNGSGNGSEESLREEFAGEKRVQVRKTLDLHAATILASGMQGLILSRILSWRQTAILFLNRKITVRSCGKSIRKSALIF